MYTRPITFLMYHRAVLTRTFISETTMSAGGACWSHLPDDLLILITNRLTFFSNLIRFSAVCRGWRRMAVQHQSFSPCTLPSIMLPTVSPPPRLITYSLYCPFSSQGFPDLFNLQRDRYKIGGSPDGWLIQIDYSGKIVLDNPLLQRRIHMPPIPSCHKCYYIKAAASTSGRHGSKDLSVAIFSLDKLFLARPGDDSWRVGFIRYWNVADIIYHKQQFYGVSEDGILVAFNENSGGGRLNRPNIISRLPPDSQCPINLPANDRPVPFLVESSKGELLLVLKSAHESCWFKVFKLLEYNKHAFSSWLEVEDLGGDAILLSRHLSIAISTAASSGCRENCIYFVTNPVSKNSSYMNVYRMNMGCIVDYYPLKEPFDGQISYLFEAYNWVLDRKI